MTDLARQLHELADQVDTLKPAEAVGRLEALKFEIWSSAMGATAPPPSTSVALDVEDVVLQTGMSRGWIYREARAGRLPFARRLGRRLVFDEAGLARWLERRRAHP